MNTTPTNAIDTTICGLFHYLFGFGDTSNGLIGHFFFIIIDVPSETYGSSNNLYQWDFMIVV
jgi:hypothetical protein